MLVSDGNGCLLYVACGTVGWLLLCPTMAGCFRVYDAVFEGRVVSGLAVNARQVLARPAHERISLVFQRGTTGTYTEDRHT